jgi:hypothetical protein
MGIRKFLNKGVSFVKNVIKALQSGVSTQVARSWSRLAPNVAVPRAIMYEDEKKDDSPVRRRPSRLENQLRTALEGKLKNIFSERRRKKNIFQGKVNRLEERLKQSYIISIPIDCERVRPNGDVTRFRTTQNIPLTSTPAELWRDIELLKESLTEVYKEDVIIDGEITFKVSHSAEAIGRLAAPRLHIPMRAALPVGFTFLHQNHAVEAVSMPTTYGCVYDALYKIYSKKDGCIKLFKNIENLREKMGITRSIDEGVTAEELGKFCEHLKIGMYCLTPSWEIFHEYTPPDNTRSHRLPPLMFMQSNDHMYLITKESARRSIAMRVVNSSFKSSDKEKDEKCSKMKEDGNNRYNNSISIHHFDNENIELNNESICMFERFISNNLSKSNMYFNVFWDLEKLLKALILKNNIFYESMSDNKGKICKIAYDANIFITNNPDINFTHKICQDYNIKFENQTLAGVARILFEKLGYDPHEFNSSFNPQVQEVINNIVLTPFHYYDQDVDEKCTTIDIQKCYSTCLRNPLADFMIFDTLCEIEAFTGDKIPDDCLLYLDIYNSVFPFKGSNWYPSSFLQYFYQEGLVKLKQIKFMIRARRVCSRDYFTKMVDKIYEQYPDEKYPKCAKRLQNYFVGLTSKISTKKFFVKYASDTQTVSEIFNKYNKRYLVTCESFLGKYFQLTLMKTKDEFFVENARVIYLQVICDSIMRLYKLTKIVQGEIIGMNTDSVSYKNFKGFTEEKKDNFFGGYRIEPFKFKSKKPQCKFAQAEHPCIEKRPYRFLNFTQMKKTEDPECNQPLAAELFDFVTAKKSLVITGKPGTGKSTITKQLIKLLQATNSSLLVGAFTLTAALNIDGRTLSSIFGMDYGYNYSIPSCDYFIVDEFSMIPSIFLKMFKKMKENGTVFVLVGDYHQLPPIENEYATFKEDSDRKTYHLSSIFKYIVDHNRMEMTTRLRYDEKLAEQLDRILDDLPYLLKPEVGDEEKFIVYTNKTRKILNLHMMNKKRGEIYFHMPTLHKYPNIIIKYNDLDCTKKPRKTGEYSQKWYLYAGMPVIAITTRRKGSGNLFENGREFKVLKFTLSKALYEESKNMPGVAGCEVAEESLCVLFDEKYKLELTIGLDILAMYFVPSYAVTAFRAQGCTFFCPYVIYDFKKMYKSMKYTAVGRANLYDNVRKHDDSYKKGCIYKIPCLDCKKCYIGETENFTYRMKQHKYEAQLASDSDEIKIKSKSYSLVRHAKLHKFDWDNVEIIEYEDRYSKRLNREKYYINHFDSINEKR